MSRDAWDFIWACIALLAVTILVSRTFPWI
jgi:hypothetical protein